MPLILNSPCFIVNKFIVKRRECIWETTSAIIHRTMAGKRSKTKDKRPVFDSIRKPIAPPTQKFGGAKAEEKVHPAARKIKHKNKVKAEDKDADL